MNRNEIKEHGGKHTRPRKWVQLAGPAGPATTAIAPFPTGDNKAARHIEGNMSKTNTNKEVPPWNGQ